MFKDSFTSEIITELGPKSAHEIQKMPIIKNKELSDPGLTIYRDLRNTNLTRQSGYFIAEGWRVVERLLKSRFEIQSILLNEKRKYLLAGKVSDRTDVFILPEHEASQLVGFQFHQGVLACAKREEIPSLETVAGQRPGTIPVVLCCPKITAPDNLGSLIRLGASFGIQGILLGPGSVDPYIRRVIRVSMGTFFNLPIRSSRELFKELKELRQQNRCRIIAAEKTESSQTLTDIYQSDALPDAAAQTCPTILLLGNEADGLAQQWLELADETLHIPIQADVDSLNVTHAAAIFLYELARRK